MKCDRELLVAYVLDDLNDQERQKVEAHLQTCPTCADHVAELRAALKVAATLPEPESRPISMNRLRRAIAAREVADERPTRPKARVVAVWRWAIAAAAAAVLAVACFHYGVALRVGSFEVALGGEVAGHGPTLDENAVRNVVGEEMVARITPVLATLAQAIEERDARQQEELVALHHAVALQRDEDMSEVTRNIGLIASTVSERLGAQ
ncbi:zf-HC2 domain-containing protein [Candidatus Sumerlaeota bacterium]|nr:zf-HC2 domain-containing protein [Candidatus Sumerlaeota bacterium]